MKSTNLKYIEVGLNVLFWVLSGWLIMNSFSIVGQEIEILDGVETVRIERDGQLLRQLGWLLICSAVMFYSNYRILQDLKSSFKGKWIIARSIFIIIIVFLAYLALCGIDAYPNNAYIPYTLSIGIFTFYLMVATAYAMIKVFLHSERQKEQLVLEKNQAELSLLRSQLHPHFLFNTLNNLMADIKQDEHPHLAQSLDKLSSLLRYVVTDIKDQKVPIKKEIDFIRNYADLHQLRFAENEVTFTLQVYGENDNQLIEPGIFIPFVENAFKYGVEPEKHSDIFISFNLSKPNNIGFTCKNDIFPEMQRLNGSGSGIDSTRRRLQLVYPQKNTINIYENEKFEVAIELITD